LNVEEEKSVEKIKKQMIDNGTVLAGDDLDKAAKSALLEYTLHTDGIKECYKKFVYEAPSDKPVDEMEQDLFKMVKIKLKEPMRPPRIVILGPPGSGRSTQAKSISQKYGIVHVSVVDLLRNEMRRKTTRGTIISNCLSKGEMVPSIIVISLVEHRLKDSDCIVNGWIMDGFPKTVEQASLLKQMKIVPTKVVILECKQEVCVERLGTKRIDPITGQFYNLSDAEPEDKVVLDRLIEIDGNDEQTVKRRWLIWDEFVGKIEEMYSH
jgi:adenylate kinase